MPVMETKRKPAVTRDLTQAFRRHRIAQRRRREGGAAHTGSYPGSDPLLEGASSGAEGVLRGKVTLPPRWVDFADRAKEDVKEIREQLARLANAQERRLQRGDAGDAPDQEVEAISAAIATQIRVCEQTIHQVRTSGGESTLLDDEFRQNTQRSLAAQLQQLSKQCRELQKGYMKEVKRRRQKSNKAADLELGQAPGAPSAAASPAADQGLSQMQLLELENMEDFAVQRSSEVAQIAGSIEELNRIFRELAVMVIDQGSILDRIDYNTEKIYKRSDDGRKQVEKAVATKRKNDSRAAWCFMSWAVADAVALVVLLVKWHLKYGLKNVLIFVCFLAALCAAMWYGWRHLQPLCCPKLTSCLQCLPEGLDPTALWKKFRPGPVNAAKAAVAAGGGGVGGGLNAMRHVWRPPGS